MEMKILADADCSTDIRNGINRFAANKALEALEAKEEIDRLQRELTQASPSLRLNNRTSLLLLTYNIL